MYKIYKYELELTDNQSLTLPENSKILTVIEQNNKIVLYAKVSDSEWQDFFMIHIRGTGHPIFETAKYLNTVKINQFVWHVFYQ